MKKTGFFALFVGVLLALTYFFEVYQPSQDEHKKEQTRLIVDFPAAQINQIKMVNPLGSFLLKRDVNGWSLVEPVKDWADSTFTDDFVNAMTTEKSLDVAVEGDSIQWAVYGLDKPNATVTFTNQENKDLVVEVSAKKNFEGNNFLRRNHENKVLVVGSQWAARTEKTALDFRDKRLYRGRIVSIDKMEARSEDDKFSLVQKDGKWIEPDQPNLKLDQNVVHEILSGLNEVRAKDFATEVPAKSVSVAHVTLTLKDKTWSADFKQAPDKNVYAVVSDPAFILKLDPGQSGQFLHMNLATLRDRSDAFAFDTAAVSRIELQNKLKKLVLTKNKDSWKLEGDEKTPLESAKVAALVDSLHDSRVTQYVSAKDQAQFKNPENKMTLLKDDHQVVAEFAWGPSLEKAKNGKASMEKPLVLARSSLYKEIFALDQSVIDSWGLLQLTQPTPKPETKTAAPVSPAMEVH